MKRKLLSIILCIAMIITALPASVFTVYAAGGTGFSCPYDPTGDYFELVLRKNDIQDTEYYEWDGDTLSFKKNCTIGPIYLEHDPGTCTIELNGHLVNIYTDTGHCGVYLSGAELKITGGTFSISMENQGGMYYEGFSTFGIIADSVELVNLPIFNINNPCCGIYAGSVDFRNVDKTNITLQRTDSVGIKTRSLSFFPGNRWNFEGELKIKSVSHALYLTEYDSQPYYCYLDNVDASFTSEEDQFAVYADNPNRSYMRVKSHRGNILNITGSGSGENKSGCNVPIFFDTKEPVTLDHAESFTLSTPSSSGASIYSGSYPLTFRTNTGKAVEVNANSLTTGSSETYDDNPGIEIKKISDSQVDITLDSYNGGPIHVSNPGTDTRYNVILKGRSQIITESSYGDPYFLSHHELQETIDGGLFLENADKVDITQPSGSEVLSYLDIDFETKFGGYKTAVTLNGISITGSSSTEPELTINSGTKVSVNIPENAFDSLYAYCAMGITTGTSSHRCGTVKVNGILSVNIIDPAKFYGICYGISSGTVIDNGKIDISLNDTSEEDDRNSANYHSSYYGIYAEDFLVYRDASSFTIAVPYDYENGLNGQPIESENAGEWFDALEISPIILYTEENRASSDKTQYIYSFAARGNSGSSTGGMYIDGRHYDSETLATNTSGRGWTWTAGQSMLTLHNYTGDFIAVDSNDTAQNVTIKLTGNNTINSTRGYGILGNPGSGAGSITITTDNSITSRLTINVSEVDTQVRFSTNYPVCGIATPSGKLKIEKNADVRINVSPNKPSDPSIPYPWPEGIYTEHYDIFDNASLRIDISGYSAGDYGYGVTGSGRLYTSGDFTVNSSVSLRRNFRQNTADSLEILKIGTLRSTAIKQPNASLASSSFLTYDKTNYGIVMTEGTGSTTYTVSHAYPVTIPKSDKYTIASTSVYSDVAGNYQVFYVPVGGKLTFTVTCNDGYIKGADFRPKITTRRGTDVYEDYPEYDSAKKTYTWTRSAEETNTSTLTLGGVREEKLFIDDNIDNSRTYLVSNDTMNSYPAYVELAVNSEELKNLSGSIILEKYTGGEWVSYQTIREPASGVILVNISKVGGVFQNATYRFKGVVRNPDTHNTATYYSREFTLSFTENPDEADSLNRINIYIYGENGGQPFTLDSTHPCLNRESAGGYSFSNQAQLGAERNTIAAFYPEAALLFLYESEINGRIEVPEGCVGTLNVAVSSSHVTGTVINSGKYPGITNRFGDIILCGQRFINTSGVLKINVDTGDESDAAYTMSADHITAGIFSGGNVYIGDYSNVPTQFIPDDGEYESYDKLDLRISVNNKIENAKTYGILSRCLNSLYGKTVKVTGNTRVSLNVSSMNKEVYAIRAKSYYQDLDAGFFSKVDITLDGFVRYGIYLDANSTDPDLADCAMVMNGPLTIKDDAAVAALAMDARGYFLPFNSVSRKSPLNLNGSSEVVFQGYASPENSYVAINASELNINDSAKLTLLIEGCSDSYMGLTVTTNINSDAEIPLDASIKNYYPDNSNNAYSGIGNVYFNSGKSIRLGYTVPERGYAYVVSEGCYRRRNVDGSSGLFSHVTDTVTRATYYSVALNDSVGGLDNAEGLVYGGIYESQADYEPGDTVYIQPPAPAEGFKFDHWEVTTGEVSDIKLVESGSFKNWYSFTMPGHEVRLQAVFSTDVIENVIFTKTSEDIGELTWTIKEGYTLSNCKLELRSWGVYYYEAAPVNGYSNPEGLGSRFQIVRSSWGENPGFVASEGADIRVAATATKDGNSFPVFSNPATVDWQGLTLTGVSCGAIPASKVGQTPYLLPFGETFNDYGRDYTFRVESSTSMGQNGFEFYKDQEDGWTLKFTPLAAANAEDCYIVVSSSVPRDSVRIPFSIGAVTWDTNTSDAEKYDLYVCGIQVTSANKDSLTGELERINGIEKNSSWSDTPAAASFEPTGWTAMYRKVMHFNDREGLEFTLEKNDEEGIWIDETLYVYYDSTNYVTRFYYIEGDNTHYNPTMDEHGNAYNGSKEDYEAYGILLGEIEGKIADKKLEYYDYSENYCWSFDSVAYTHIVTEGILHLTNATLKAKGYFKNGREHNTDLAVIESGLRKLTIDVKEDAGLDYSGCPTTDEGHHNDYMRYGVLCNNTDTWVESKLAIHTDTWNALYVKPAEDRDCQYDRDIYVEDDLTVDERSALSCSGRIDCDGDAEINGQLSAGVGIYVENTITINGSIDADHAYISAYRIALNGNAVLHAAALKTTSNESTYAFVISDKAEVRLNNIEYNDTETAKHDEYNYPCELIGAVDATGSRIVSFSNDYCVKAECSTATYDESSYFEDVVWEYDEYDKDTKHFPVKDSSDNLYLYFSITYDEQAMEEAPYLLTIGGSTMLLDTAKESGYGLWDRVCIYVMASGDVWEIREEDIRTSADFYPQCNDWKLVEDGGELYLYLYHYFGPEINLLYRGDETPMPLNIVVVGKNKVFGGITYNGGTINVIDTSSGMENPVEVYYANFITEDPISTDDLLSHGISEDDILEYLPDILMVQGNIIIDADSRYEREFSGISAEGLIVDNAEIYIDISSEIDPLTNADDVYGRNSFVAMYVGEGGCVIDASYITVDINDPEGNYRSYFDGISSFSSVTLRDSTILMDMSSDALLHSEMNGIEVYADSDVTICDSELEINLTGDFEDLTGIYNGGDVLIDDSIVAVDTDREHGTGIRSNGQITFQDEAKVDLTSLEPIRSQSYEPLTINLTGDGYLNCHSYPQANAINSWVDISVAPTNGILKGRMYRYVMYCDMDGEASIIVKRDIGKIDMVFPSSFKLTDGLPVYTAEGLIYNTDVAANNIGIDGSDNSESNYYENVSGLEGLYYGLGENNTYMWYHVDSEGVRTAMDYEDEFAEGERYQLAVRTIAGDAYEFANPLYAHSSMGAKASVNYVIEAHDDEPAVIEIMSDYIVAGPMEAGLVTKTFGTNVYATVYGIPTAKLDQYKLYIASYDGVGRMIAFDCVSIESNGEISLPLRFEYESRYSYLVTMVQEDTSTPIVESAKLERPVY